MSVVGKHHERRLHHDADGRVTHSQRHLVRDAFNVSPAEVAAAKARRTVMVVVDEAPDAGRLRTLDEQTRDRLQYEADALDLALARHFAAPPQPDRPAIGTLMREADAPDWFPPQNPTRLPHPNDSLAARFPNAAESWHPWRNGAILPSDVAWDSKQAYYFSCRWCGRAWVEEPWRRVRNTAVTCHACKRIPKEQDTAPVFDVIERRSRLAEWTGR